MGRLSAQRSDGESSGKANARGTRRRSGWILLWAVFFAAIIVPFILFEDQIAQALNASFAAVRGQPWLGAALIVALLAGDSLLPVPSSLVSAFAGAAFPWLVGTAVVWIGMTLGCLLGYGLGASAGRVLALRLVGKAELARSRTLFSNIGPAALIITRAIPVMAEAGVLAAGAARMPFWPFLLATSVANAGVAAAFAATGALAASSGAFLIVFIGLAAIPAVGWAAWRQYNARRSRVSP
jgi:uncharacterized membrane protein YdjX (TVP38/TMEM64 family)